MCDGLLFIGNYLQRVHQRSVQRTGWWPNERPRQLDGALNCGIGFATASC